MSGGKSSSKSPSFNDYKKRVRSEYIRIKQQRRLKNTLGWWNVIDIIFVIIKRFRQEAKAGVELVRWMEEGHWL